PSTTPAITLGTSVTGVLKGNGTAISAAIAGTDYLTPTGSAAGLTSFPILNQNTTGTAAGLSANIAESQVTNLATDLSNKQASLSGTGYLKFSTTTPSYLTPTQVTADLDVFTTSSKGLVPAPFTSNTTDFLRRDGVWAAPATSTGTLTSLSIATANGFSGTSSGGTTPIITLTTPINGLLKGNGTAISAAVAGTDYLTPTGSAAALTSFPTLNQNTTGSAASFTGSLVGDVTGTQGANVVRKINGVTMSGLATGILKNTITTGVPSIAIASDFPILNQNTTGTASNITGIIALSNGGTGQTTANASLNALLPTQTGQAGKVLSTDGTNSSWVIASGGSGTGDMILASVQTVTGLKTFNNSKISFAGTTSGAVILNAPAVAGSGTVILPLSGTLATVSGTETLANKNLTSGTNIFPTFNQSTTGNAATATLAANVTTNANLTGPVTSVGNATTITAASVTNAMLAGSIDLSTKVTGLLADARISSAANWNTAFSWGNHASAGYLTSITGAVINSPVFTGTPSLPTGTIAVTQLTSDSSTKIATTAFAKKLVSDMLTALIPDTTFISTASSQIMDVIAGAKDSLNFKQQLPNKIIASNTSGSSLGDMSARLMVLNDLPIISSGVLLGRSTSGSGNVENITLGSNLTLVGGVLNSTGGSGGGTADSTILGGKKTFISPASVDNYTFSSEIFSSFTSTGWTGSFGSGFTHTTGNTSPLTSTTGVGSSSQYRLVYTITGRTAGTVTVTGGGLYDIVTASDSVDFNSTSTAPIIFTPTTDFNGTLVVSFKGINATTPALIYTANDGTIINEVRSNKRNNIYEGIGTGRVSTTAHDNYFSGNAAGSLITSGQNNLGIGNYSLLLLDRGNNNVGLGMFSGGAINVGSNNLLAGAFAAQNNTYGSNNVVLGFSSSNTLLDGVTNVTFMDNTVAVGNNIKLLTNGETNSINIGSSVLSRGTNTTTIGNSSITSAKLFGQLNIGTVQNFTNNAAAITGGLAVGDVYRNGDLLQVVH
ncbi:MAG: hypothetical protein ABIP51_20595, partial [Bacteroidia bacterium]